MFSQSSIYPDTISSQQTLKAPIGTGLAGATPSLSPNDGSLALNQTNNKIYYAGSNTWKAMDGDLSGPSSATDNAIVRFDGTSGKLTQNSVVIISDAGDITGVNTINGQAPLVTLAAFGSSPNANGASISNQVITLQPASVSQPGGVSTGAQTFNGIKAFDDGVQLLNIDSALQSLYNTPTYFEQSGSLLGSLPQLVLNGGGSSTNVHWHLQKIGRNVMMSVGSSTAVTISVNGNNIFSPAGTIPTTFRPVSVVRTAQCLVVNGGVRQVGYVTINLDGSLLWATTLSGTGFSNSGSAGTEDFTFVYTL